MTVPEPLPPLFVYRLAFAEQRYQFTGHFFRLAARGHPVPDLLLGRHLMAVLDLGNPASAPAETPGKLVPRQPGGFAYGSKPLREAAGLGQPFRRRLQAVFGVRWRLQPPPRWHCGLP